MGEAKDVWAERIELLAPYQVNADVARRTGQPDVRFMHCLPAFHDREHGRRRARSSQTGMLDGLEVTDDVFESPALDRLRPGREPDAHDQGRPGRHAGRLTPADGPVAGRGRDDRATGPGQAEQHLTDPPGGVHRGRRDGRRRDLRPARARRVRSRAPRSGSRSSSPASSPALQGYSFAKFGARYPSAGGLLEYVAKGFGRRARSPGSSRWLTRRQRHRDRHGGRVLRQLRQLDVRRRRRGLDQGVRRRSSSWS